MFGRSPTPTSPPSKKISPNLITSSYQQTEDIEVDVSDRPTISESGLVSLHPSREAAFISISLVIALQIVFLIASAIFMRGATIAGTALGLYYIVFAIFTVAQTVYCPPNMKKFILFWHVSSLGRFVIFSFLSVVVMHSASFLLGVIALLLSVSLLIFHILFSVDVPQPLFQRKNVTNQFTLADMYKSPPQSAQPSPYYSTLSSLGLGQGTSSVMGGP